MLLTLGSILIGCIFYYFMTRVTSVHKDPWLDLIKQDVLAELEL